MEADFARYYQLDLADYYRGRLTLRRVRSLLQWLPAEAAVWESRKREREAEEREQQLADLEAIQTMFSPNRGGVE